MVFSETSSGFVTRAICDHASVLIFSEILAGDRPSNLEQSDWLYGFLVRMERSDWLVWSLLIMERSDWLVRNVVRKEPSDWLVQNIVRKE